MDEAKKEVDLEAAKTAMLSGQSLIDHLNLPPDLAKVLYAVAQGHFDARRFSEAKQACIYLVALDARMRDAWALLGNCFMREGEFQEALEAWSHALYVKPDFALAVQVTRTALALKDPVSSAIGLVAMQKQGSSPEQLATCEEMAELLLAMDVTE